MLLMGLDKGVLSPYLFAVYSDDYPLNKTTLKWGVILVNLIKSLDVC